MNPAASLLTLPLATLAHIALALAAVALGFRLARRGPRRVLGVAWGLLVLAVLALAALAWWGEATTTAPALRTVATLALGMAAVQIAGTVLFGGILPLLRLPAPRIAQDLTVAGLSVLVLLLWLRASGLEASQLFTTSALITAVLAFAMQDTLGNVLGGVSLQLDNSLRVGDWVRVDDGVSGRVVDVRWRVTELATPRGESIMVPNAWLMKNRFAIVRPAEDGQPAWRRSVEFDLELQADPAEVIAVLQQVLADADIAHVRRQPAPTVVLLALGYGWARYSLRYWLDDPARDDPTDSAVRQHALAALARAGIRLGVPQQEQRMIKENESWRAAQEARELQRRLAAIAQTALFAGLSTAEQQALAAHLVHAPFAAGDTMTRQGAVAHWLYLIVKGEAQVLHESATGRQPLAVLRAGDCFGEMGMLTGEPRQATVVATTAVDCYRLDKAGFAMVLQSRPDIAQEVSDIMRRRQAESATPSPEAGHTGASDLLQRIRHFFSLGA